MQPAARWRAANNGDRRSGGEGEGQRDASGDATVTQRCVPSAPSGMAARAWVSGFTRDVYVTSFGSGGICHFYRHVAPPLAAADPFDAVATHFISLSIALLQRKLYVYLCGDTQVNAGLALLQWRNLISSKRPL